LGDALTQNGKPLPTWKCGRGSSGWMVRGQGRPRRRAKDLRKNDFIQTKPGKQCELWHSITPPSLTSLVFSSRVSIPHCRAQRGASVAFVEGPWLLLEQLPCGLGETD